jgi:hypothetical protein
MMGFLLRWVVAFVLLSATFNPTDWNYVRWASGAWETQTPIVVLIGLVLTIAYVIYLRATFRSIGPIGMALVAALVGALVWVLIDWGVLSLANQSLNVWIGIFLLSAVLGIGLSWSIVRRRLSGQADVDDVDE